MAENVSYLNGMLEVPIIEGQSEDICGQDDRYYAFGMWTDFCGLSNEEMKKAAIANAAGSSECCGSGSGGGGDTGNTGTSKTENIIAITNIVRDGKVTVTATADKAVDTEVTLTIPYIVLKDDGSTETREATITIQNGQTTGSTVLDPDDGTATKIKNNIEVEPAESDKYEFKVENKTDLKNNSILYGTVYYLEMQKYGIDAISYSTLEEFGEVQLTGEAVEFSSSRDAEVVDNYRGQTSIRNEHAYDFIFLIDSDLDVADLVVTDMQGIGDGEVVDLGQSIGSIDYDGELYAAYRLSNPVGWSVVVSPDEQPIGYEWKYKIEKK